MSLKNLSRQQERQLQLIKRHLRHKQQAMFQKLDVSNQKSKFIDKNKPKNILKRGI
jgi:hypothetical protein